MSLFGRWRKPDWEHKDAAVRARAVRSSADPALLARLTELAQRDPAAEVRLAAIARIDDPVLLARRVRGDHDAQVAAAARSRLIDRLCSDGPSLDERRAVLRDVIDVDVLARVAECAVDSEMRRDALEKLDRPGLLVERCVADPDRSIRMWLLERIDSVDALLRIEREARKRDKTLTRAARERIDALQLAAGDPAALERRVRALCERLEQLSRELPADRRQVLAALEADWQALQAQVDVPLAARARAFIDLARTTVEAAERGPMPAPAVDAEPLPATASTADVAAAADAAVTAPAEPAFDALLAALPAADADDAVAALAGIEAEAERLHTQHAGNATVAAQFAQLSERIRHRRDEIQRRAASARAAAEAEVVARLDAIDAAVRDGSLSAARAAREAIGTAPLPPRLRQRLAAADTAIGKLEQWQRWSGNRVRGRLCDEVEALHGSGLHPDAVATRVKELQAEWARLDAIEGAAAPAADSGLARRFRALCHRALAPARGYFEKRDALRRGRADAIDTLLDEASRQIDGADANVLVDLRRQVAATLRDLDGVPPQRRGALGRALRERLAAIDARLAEQREQAAVDKRRLIAKLRRELQADPGSALDAARRVQADWKRLPRADRAADDALWTELRGLIDPLFEQARGEATAVRQRQADAEQAAAAILDELRALADGDGERLLHADATIEALIGRWRELAPPQPAAAARKDRDAPRRSRAPAAQPREQEFDAAVERVRAARARHLAERELQSFEALCRAAERLDRHAAEPLSPQTLEDELAALPLSGEARQVLQQRLQVGERGELAVADQQQAELLAVRAELAAGLPSPAHAQLLRRQEQIRRLAAKMEHRIDRPPVDEVREQLFELAALTLPIGHRQALQQRVLEAYRAAVGR